MGSNSSSGSYRGSTAGMPQEARYHAFNNNNNNINTSYNGMPSDVETIIKQKIKKEQKKATTNRKSLEITLNERKKKQKGAETLKTDAERKKRNTLLKRDQAKTKALKAADTSKQAQKEWKDLIEKGGTEKELKEAEKKSKKADDDLTAAFKEYTEAEKELSKANKELERKTKSLINAQSNTNKTKDKLENAIKKEAKLLGISVSKLKNKIKKATKKKTTKKATTKKTTSSKGGSGGGSGRSGAGAAAATTAISASRNTLGKVNVTNNNLKKLQINADKLKQEINMQQMKIEQYQNIIQRLEAAIKELEKAEYQSTEARNLVRKNYEGESPDIKKILTNLDETINNIQTKIQRLREMIEEAQRQIAIARENIKRLEDEHLATLDKIKAEQDAAKVKKVSNTKSKTTTKANVQKTKSAQTKQTGFKKVTVKTKTAFVQSKPGNNIGNISETIVAHTFGNTDIIREELLRAINNKK